MAVRKGRALALSVVCGATLCCSDIPGLSFLAPTSRGISRTAPGSIKEGDGSQARMPASSTMLAVTTSEPNTKTAGGCAFVAAVGSLLAVSAARDAKRGRRAAKSAAVVPRQAGKTVVIAGPPAAGKGTQCERIKEKYGYVHISTGDILRANVKEGTDLGKKAKEYMDKGALVPSELIVDLVKDRLAQPDVQEKGCLLDGFPRAPDQAKAMIDAGIKVDKFVVIEVPDDTLVERGCGRRLDPETGEIYHMKFKPPPAEVLDRLVHRSDDQEEAIRNRLKIYHEQVNGILPFFDQVCDKLDGTGKPDEVWALMQTSLD